MIILPVIKGNVVRNCHPLGCQQAIQNHIQYIETQGGARAQDGVRAQDSVEIPKRVVVLGGSSGYGLATRLCYAFLGGADTISLSFERPFENEENLGTAGFWNDIFFKKEAEKKNLKAINLQGDVFSQEAKQAVIQNIREHMKGGQIDALVYSIAAPKRIDKFGDTYKSVLKVRDKVFKAPSIVLESGDWTELSLDVATDEEVYHTVKVMGGEDWQDWVETLQEAGVLAKHFTTYSYSYEGPESMDTIYKHGTIGAAKRSLEEHSLSIDSYLRSKVGGQALIVVGKALSTKASAFIPLFPIYAGALYKIMRKRGWHEEATEQAVRLFHDKLYGHQGVVKDEHGFVRTDDLELNKEVQSEVKAILKEVTPDNVFALTDWEVFRKTMMQINGFEVEHFDDKKEIDIEMLQSLAGEAAPSLFSNGGKL